MESVSDITGAGTSFPPNSHVRNSNSAICIIDSDDKDNHTTAGVKKSKCATDVTQSKANGPSKNLSSTSLASSSSSTSLRIAAWERRIQVQSGTCQTAGRIQPVNEVIDLSDDDQEACSGQKTATVSPPGTQVTSTADFRVCQIRPSSAVPAQSKSDPLASVLPEYPAPDKYQYTAQWLSCLSQGSISPSQSPAVVPTEASFVRVKDSGPSLVLQQHSMQTSGMTSTPVDCDVEMVDTLASTSPDLTFTDRIARDSGAAHLTALQTSQNYGMTCNSLDFGLSTVTWQTPPDDDVVMTEVQSAPPLMTHMDVDNVSLPEPMDVDENPAAVFSMASYIPCQQGPPEAMEFAPYQVLTVQIPSTHVTQSSPVAPRVTKMNNPIPAKPQALPWAQIVSDTKTWNPPKTKVTSEVRKSSSTDTKAQSTADKPKSIQLNDDTPVMKFTFAEPLVMYTAPITKSVNNVTQSSTFRTSVAIPISITAAATPSVSLRNKVDRGRLGIPLSNNKTIEKDLPKRNTKMAKELRNAVKPPNKELQNICSPKDFCAELKNAMQQISSPKDFKKALSAIQYVFDKVSPSKGGQGDVLEVPDGTRGRRKVSYTDNNVKVEVDYRKRKVVDNAKEHDVSEGRALKKQKLI